MASDLEELMNRLEKDIDQWTMEDTDNFIIHLRKARMQHEAGEKPTKPKPLKVDGSSILNALIKPVEKPKFRRI